MVAKENAGKSLPVTKCVCLLAGISFMVSAAPAQTFTILHAFSSPVILTNHDGANPMAGLAPLGNVLCGTTVNGGRYAAGAAFYLNPDGTGFNAFRFFTNQPDAGNPLADLVVSDNAFFSATFGGGTKGTGAIFTGQTNGAGSVVYSFAALNSDNATNLLGASPGAPAVLSGGTLFGTATAGGSFANGVVFSIATNGSAASTMHNFTALDPVTGTNTDGAAPWGSLVLSGGTLYGTSSTGGAGGNGTVFSVNTNGGNFTTLYSFTPMDPLTGTNTDGAVPMAGLVLSNGMLYGTTVAGGFGDSGTIFSIGTNGSGFTVLHQFLPVDTLTHTNTDGAYPQATLILSSNTLYGTAAAGGTGADGAVFSLNTGGTQFKTLYNFTATNPRNGTNTDGAFPVADLLLSGNSLYGTTFSGGPGAAGTVFSLTLPVIVPAVITNIVRNLDGSITLSFLGSPNSTNAVRAATNLLSATWQDLSTNVADGGGTWQFTDTNAIQFPVRFYRSYSF